MQLPPAVEKFIGDLDKKLHQPSYFNDIFDNIEKKTGVKRLHIVGGFFVLNILYLIFGHYANLMCNFIGFAYPAYISVKAIESAPKEDDTQWLTYWVVYAFFSVIETFSVAIVSVFPLYWLFKCAFCLYLYLPFTNGAQVLYFRFVKPVILKHQQTIDDALKRAAKVGDSAREQFEKTVKAN
uniref:Receptor expression-enhancing protein n=1 Tax=Parastrongyloides trichosuri TaxID=131310 RepID=A0A0N4ZUC2_PARTI